VIVKDLIEVMLSLCRRQGEDWAYKRKAVRSLMLRPNSMASMTGLVNGIAESLLSKIKNRRDANGFVAELPQETYRWAFEGIMHIVTLKHGSWNFAFSSVRIEKNTHNCNPKHGLPVAWPTQG